MLIKFALGGGAFKIFENAEDVTYVSRQFPPKEIYHVSSADTTKNEEPSFLYFTFDGPEGKASELGFEHTYKKVPFDLSITKHMHRWAYDLASMGAITESPINPDPYHMIFSHERSDQVYYNFIRFISGGTEYRILSSYPIYLCNDSGKTIEALIA